MKKIATILTAVALLASNGAYAQSTAKSTTMGKGAQAAKDCSYNNFAWGIGLGMLAVVAIVVGVTAGVSSQSSSSFSH